MRQVSPSPLPWDAPVTLIRPIPVTLRPISVYPQQHRHHHDEALTVPTCSPSGRMAPAPEEPILDIDLLQFEHAYYYQPKAVHYPPQQQQEEETCCAVTSIEIVRPTPRRATPNQTVPRSTSSSSTAITAASSSTCSSSSSTSSCSSSSNTRRVRFALQTQVHVLPPVTWTTVEERQALWYSKDAIRQMSAQEKRDLAEYNNTPNPEHDHEAYVRRLLQVWSCPLPSSQLVLMHDIAHGPVRGLEKQVLPMMRQRRVTVVRRVLQAQQELRELELTRRTQWDDDVPCVWKDDFHDLEEEDNSQMMDMAEALRDRYVPLTRTSARFARALAEGDALAAAAVMATTTTD